MGHHGSEYPYSEEEFKDEFKDLLKKANVDQAPKSALGATGKFPDGKLNKDDEGEIAIGITHSKGKGDS